MKATFAAGCFWHAEEAFRKVKGVTSTKVGYTGGSLRSPTYKDVCTDKTGHAEALEVDFDPSITSYEKLLEVFWSIHDPTSPDRQGPDVGTQYRSAVFYHDSEQRRLAKEAIQRLESSGEFRGRHIVTEVVPASEFWPAEEYHQRYLEKRGMHTCRVC